MSSQGTSTSASTNPWMISSPLLRRQRQQQQQQQVLNADDYDDSSSSDDDNIRRSRRRGLSESSSAPSSSSSGNLHWRLDPLESLSDWTLRITTTTTTTTTPTTASSSSRSRGSITEGQAAVDGTDADHADVVAEEGDYLTGATSSARPAAAVYHVHKCILAVGPRKSEYFATLFRNPRFAEAASSTSNIDLHELAANAFPLLLDYLYCGVGGGGGGGGNNSNDHHHEHLLEGLTTETAVPLYFLAKYFEVPPLCSAVKEFWKRDLGVWNCDVYYEHARIFHFPKIAKAAAATCGANIMRVSSSSRICQIADAQLWLDVILATSSSSSSPSRPRSQQQQQQQQQHPLHPGETQRQQQQQQPSSEFSRHLSTLIAAFLSSNCGGGDDDAILPLDAELFEKLTGKDALPVIHFEAAKTFIELEKKFVAAEKVVPPHPPDGDAGANDNSDNDDEDDDEETLSDLQERCIQALSDDWDRIEMTETDTTDFLAKQSPRLLVKLLSLSLSNARYEKSRSRRESGRIKDSQTRWRDMHARVREERDECLEELRCFYPVSSLADVERDDNPTAVPRKGGAAAAGKPRPSFSLRESCGIYPFAYSSWPLYYYKKDV